jgi:hypothetical protein
MYRKAPIIATFFVKNVKQSCQGVNCLQLATNAAVQYNFHQSFRRPVQVPFPSIIGIVSLCMQWICRWHVYCVRNSVYLILTTLLTRPTATFALYIFLHSACCTRKATDGIGWFWVIQLELDLWKRQIFSLFVCLLLCVPQGRDVFANYTGTILQVSINNSFHTIHAPARFGPESTGGSHSQR